MWLLGDTAFRVEATGSPKAAMVRDRTIERPRALAWNHRAAH